MDPSKPVERQTDPAVGGVCPECGATDGYENIGRYHWAVCDVHGVRWCIGENLFSSWKDDSYADVEAAATRLLKYRPLHTRDIGRLEAQLYELAEQNLAARRREKARREKEESDDLPF
jgi:hypothetical protein